MYMADAIINQIVCIMSRDVEDVLFINTAFTINTGKLKGKYYIYRFCIPF